MIKWLKKLFGNPSCNTTTNPDDKRFESGQKLYDFLRTNFTLDEAHLIGVWYPFCASEERNGFEFNDTCNGVVIHYWPSNGIWKVELSNGAIITNPVTIENIVCKLMSFWDKNQDRILKEREAEVSRWKN